LLLISPFVKNSIRSSEETAYKRNKYIIDISDELFIPYASCNGLISDL